MPVSGSDKPVSRGAAAPWEWRLRVYPVAIIVALAAAVVLAAAADTGTGGPDKRLGGDYPASSYVSTYRPLVLIESAVTRRLAGATDGDALPPTDEALPLPDAVRGMTALAAFQIGLGDTTGMLRRGMAADVVVLGRNLFEIPANEIAATPVVMTMMGGRITHEAGS